MLEKRNPGHFAYWFQTTIEKDTTFSLWHQNMANLIKNMYQAFIRISLVL